MSHIGRVIFLDESKMNSATAICGSGPAFYL
jgi:pyrroline-5-carboxylate reductase